MSLVHFAVELPCNVSRVIFGMFTLNRWKVLYVCVSLKAQELVNKFLWNWVLDRN